MMKTCAAVLGIVGGLLGVLFHLQSQDAFVLGGDISGLVQTSGDFNILILVLSGIAVLLSCLMFRIPRELGFAVMILGLVCIFLGDYFPGAITMSGGILGSLLKKKKRHLII